MSEQEKPQVDELVSRAASCVVDALRFLPEEKRQMALVLASEFLEEYDKAVAAYDALAQVTLALFLSDMRLTGK